MCRRFQQSPKVGVEGKGHLASDGNRYFWSYSVTRQQTFTFGTFTLSSYWRWRTRLRRSIIPIFGITNAVAKISVSNGDDMISFSCILMWHLFLKFDVLMLCQQWLHHSPSIESVLTILLFFPQTREKLENLDLHDECWSKMDFKPHLVGSSRTWFMFDIYSNGQIKHLGFLPDRFYFRLSTKDHALNLPRY